MASANLQFKIGSTFSGEGFRQAQQAANGIKTQLTPAIGAANQMASALGGMDTSATKAFGAVTNLIGAFAQGGIQGAVMAAAMMALNGYIDLLKEKAQKATEAANALTAAVKAGFSAELSGQIKTILGDVSSIRTEFENTAKQANAFAEAILGLQQSQASGGVISLEIEKFQALIEEENDALKKDIEATYDLKIAKEKQKNVAEEWSTKLDIAHQKVKQSEERVATINDQLAMLASERKDLEETLKDIAETSKDKRKEINQKMSELATKEEQLQVELQQAMADKKTELVKEQTAIQNAANANDEMKLAVEEAAQKIAETGTKWEACDPAAFINATQAQLNADRLAAAQDLAQQAQQARQTLNVANANVKEATSNAQQALNAYNNNYTQNRMWESIQTAAASGAQGLSSIRGDVLKQSQQIAQGAADIAVQRGLADGSIRTVSGMQRVANEAARQSRIDQSNKENSQAMQEAARAARLEKMSDKAMSAADKKWLQNYKKVQAANDAERKKLEQAKAEEAEAKRAQQQAWLDLRQIKDKILQLDEQGIEDELAGIKNTIANLAIK